MQRKTASGKNSGNTSATLLKEEMGRSWHRRYVTAGLALLLCGAGMVSGQPKPDAKLSKTGSQQQGSVIVPAEILYGAAYYHEYEPYERLDQDIAMMKKAGLNVVRMGESTWSLWEPEDGRFEYAWMDRVVD